MPFAHCGEKRGHRRPSYMAARYVCLTCLDWRLGILFCPDGKNASVSGVGLEQQVWEKCDVSVSAAKNGIFFFSKLPQNTLDARWPIQQTWPTQPLPKDGGGASNRSSSQSNVGHNTADLTGCRCAVLKRGPAALSRHTCRRLPTRRPRLSPSVCHQRPVINCHILTGRQNAGVLGAGRTPPACALDSRD